MQDVKNQLNSLRLSDAYICVGNLTIIGPDNGLSPGRRQAIIWTNAGTLLIRPIGTNFSEMLIEIHTFSFKKMHVKMLSGLNVLKHTACLYIPNSAQNFTY